MISTATIVFPRGKYSFEEDERLGYQHLLDASRSAGVGRFVFMSNRGPFLPRYTSRVPSLRMKMLVEEMVRASGVPYTIFRASCFMDDYFAVIGSTIPLRGVPHPTIARPFGFSRMYLKRIADLVERKGVIVVPGTASRRNSFIAMSNVVDFITTSLERPDAAGQLYDLGGPEDLTWQDVADLYARLLDRPVRVKSSAKLGNVVGNRLLMPFSPAGANQLGLLVVLAENDQVVPDTHVLADEFGVKLITAEEFLRAKMDLPPIDLGRLLAG